MGDAAQYFDWISSEWYESSEPLPEFQEILFTDTLGAVHRTTVSAPRMRAEGMRWVEYQVSETFGGGGFWPYLPLGYFVTLDVGHAPYLAVDSPLTNEERVDVVPEVSHFDTPRQVRSVRVWRATLDTLTSLSFEVTIGAQGPGCDQLLGFLSEDMTSASVVSSLWKACPEHYPVRPCALVERGGRYYALVGATGELLGAELWGVSEGVPEQVEAGR